MEIWPRGFVSKNNKIDFLIIYYNQQYLPELVVYFLVKDKNHSVHIIDSDKVRSSEVVLDKADHPTGPLVPSVVMRGPLTPVDLGHSGGQGHTSGTHKGSHCLVLILRQKNGGFTHFSLPMLHFVCRNCHLHF